MLDVIVERGSPDWGVGDLMEYPDGEIRIVVSLDEIEDVFRGVVLQESYSSKAISATDFCRISGIDSTKIGHYSRISARNVTNHSHGYNGPVKKFKGKLILEQYIKNEKEPIEYGDLVEYPDGQIVLITGWDDDDDRFEGVTLKSASLNGCDWGDKIGTYDTCYMKCFNGLVNVKKFNGKLIFKQT